MLIEHWSQEERERYCDNPNLFMTRAREIRARMFYDLLLTLQHRIKAALLARH